MSELPSVDEQKKAHIAYRKEFPTKIVNHARIKEYFKTLGFNVGSDFVEALSTDLYKTMWRAGQRTAGNKRKTLTPTDL